MGDDFEKEYAELASLYQRARSGARTEEGRKMAQADYDDAVREVAMRQQSAQRNVSRETPREPANKIAGVARAAGQGATFGFGDEAEALVRSLSPNRTYGEEVGKIRGQMAQFREENPKTAMASEIAGGIVVPGFGAARAVKTGLSGAANVAQSANSLRRVGGSAVCGLGRCARWCGFRRGRPWRTRFGCRRWRIGRRCAGWCARLRRGSRDTRSDPRGAGGIANSERWRRAGGAPLRKLAGQPSRRVAGRRADGIP